MRNRLLSLAMTLCMVLTLLPATVFAEETVETPACVCEAICAEDAMDTDCPVCGAEGAVLENCGKYVAPAEETAIEKVQALINALPTVEKLKDADEAMVNAAYEAAQDAYDALEALSPEELKQITDLEKLTALMDHFNGQISTTADIVTVSNETDLKNAFASAAGGTVKLGDNITISSYLAINGTVTLDLNGHTLTTTGARAIFIGSGNVFTLKDSSSAGSGKITGGGVQNEGTFTMQSGTITGCTAYVGGGVASSNIFIMDGGTISDCTAGNGGGVYTGGGTFTMNSGIITGCTSSNKAHGGGVYIKSGTFTMDGGTISDCTSSAGGGVYNADIFTMKSGTITGCTATNSQGGGVYNSGGTFTMKGGTITGCTANGQGGGGGVSNNTGTFDMRGGVISNCTANTTRGAGVYNKDILQNTSDAGATICYNALNHNTSGGGTISGKQVEFYNGDTLYAWEIVKDSGKASEPTAIPKTGYTFDWYTAKSGGNKFDFTTAITAKTALYARWTPIPANAPTVSVSGAEVTYGQYTDKKIGVTVTDKDEDTYSYSYQWYDSSENKIAGAIESTYTVPNNLTAGSHDYYCVVTAKRSDNGETASTKKKITVTVNKADQSAPTELVCTAETIDGKADGKITGVTSAMEYRKVGTTDYTAITGTEITGLADGKYYVRYKADDNHNASTDAEVTIAVGRKMTVTVPTTQVGYTLTVNKTELVWNDSVELTFALANGYSKLDTFAVNVNGNPITLDANEKCTVNDIQSDITITVVGVADITVPTISGIENGKTYCKAQTVTVTDGNGIASVTVNGTPVTLDANGQFTLSPASGTQTVVATDKAGNVSAEMIVTVNDGHETDTPATCTEKAVCKHCGTEYGEVDSSNHDLEHNLENAATVTATGNKEYWHCKDCDKYFSDKDGQNEIDLKDTVLSKLPPQIIEGSGQHVTAGEKKELTFRSDAAFSDFIRVEVDGKTIDEKDYTVKEGSTIVTLKADYVATLSAGEHTLGIVSESGTATTTFIVDEKVADDSTSPTTDEKEADDSISPKTGDQSNMALWFALLLISGGLLTGIGIYSKKKKDTV